MEAAYSITLQLHYNYTINLNYANVFFKLD